MPCPSACSRTAPSNPPAISNATSGAASGGATTTGPCSIALEPARSASSAPRACSPSHAPQPDAICSTGGAHAPANRNRSTAAPQGAVSGRYASARSASLLSKHGVLQRLRHPELHHALGRDLDRLARLRVAAHPRLAVCEHQPAEIRQHEDVLGFLCRERRELIHHVNDLLLGEVGLLG